MHLRDECVHVDRRHRRVRTHAAGVRALVSFADALEVLGGAKRQGGSPVAQCEQRYLRPLEELLDDCAAAEGLDRGQRSLEFRRGTAHEDALPGRQPVRLQHTRRARNRHRLCGRHSRGAQDVLGERLRALDAGGLRARPEHTDPVLPEQVGDPRDERRLRPDHREVDVGGEREREQAVAVVGTHGMAPAERSDPRVARGGVELRQARALGETPRKRVLTRSRADDEHVHAASLLRGFDNRHPRPDRYSAREGSAVLHGTRRDRAHPRRRGAGRRRRRGAARDPHRRAPSRRDDAHARPRRGARPRVRALRGAAPDGRSPARRSGGEHGRGRRGRLRSGEAAAELLHDVVVRGVREGRSRRRCSRGAARRERADAHGGYCRRAAGAAARVAGRVRAHRRSPRNRPVRRRTAPSFAPARTSAGTTRWTR